jgi:mannan endo-1,6-alpha-mannosidase
MATFFSPETFVDTPASNVMYEPACESTAKCNTDQKAFKSLLLRALSATTLLAPEFSGMITKKLPKTATSASASCNNNGDCSFVWTDAKYNGTSGVGEQLGVLESLIGVLKTTTSPDTKAFDATSGSSPSSTQSPSAPASSSSTAPSASTSAKNAASALSPSICFSWAISLLLCATYAFVA